MKTRSTAPGVFLWALAFSLGSLFAFPAQAQQVCEIVLREAEKHYQAGRLDAVFAVEGTCLRGKARRDQKIRAHELLANVYLALDEVDKAREHIAALLDLDFDFQGDRRDPALVRLVEEVRSAAAVMTVTSVSKSDEPLREAPATVVVLTAEEIERRGYLDLEAVLHDLPGFDISRSFGTTYSQIYPRGLRSDFPNRILFLIDGVEQSELYTSSIYLSRQYSVSSVERIEIIYGPTSTMYGPNAFAGVINVISKRPEEMLFPGKNFGFDVSLVSGSYDTDSLEATVVGRIEAADISWSLSGSLFQSDEMDLSGFPDWDFDPRAFELVDYTKLLRISTREGVERFKLFLAKTETEDCTGQRGCLFAISEQGVEPTATGVAFARASDRALFRQDFGGQPVGFSNATDNWSIHGKLKLGSLKIGLQRWRWKEGLLGSFTDQTTLGSENGALLAVLQTCLYARYSHRVNQTLSLGFFSRFKTSEFGPESFSPIGISYASQRLGLEGLAQGVLSFWQPFYWAGTSTELRNELSLIYHPSKRFHLVAGFESRNSTILATLLRSSIGDASVTGEPLLDLPGGNDIDSENLGFYAQATYRPYENIKLVMGGRLDDHSSRDIIDLEIPSGIPEQTILLEGNVGGGNGTIFNPRLAVIAPLKKAVFKAIYSEAFQNPSNAQKFDTIPGQLFPNPKLSSEKVKNLELSVGWQPREEVSFEVAGYDASYSNVAVFRSTPCDIEGCPLVENFEISNTGAFDIRGVQLRASYEHGAFKLVGNYSFTKPNTTRLEQNLITNPFGFERLRVGDIASHKINLLIEANLWERLDLSVRLNYVGTRRRGIGTTVNTPDFTQIPPGIGDLPDIDEHTVVHLTLSSKTLLGGANLQLLINNFFDEEYFDPGLRSADGRLYASRIPQRRRNVYLRLRYRF